MSCHTSIPRRKIHNFLMLMGDLIGNQPTLYCKYIKRARSYVIVCVCVSVRVTVYIFDTHQLNRWYVEKKIIGGKSVEYWMHSKQAMRFPINLDRNVSHPAPHQFALPSHQCASRLSKVWVTTCAGCVRRGRWDFSALFYCVQNNLECLVIHKREIYKTNLKS